MTVRPPQARYVGVYIRLHPFSRLSILSHWDRMHQPSPSFANSAPVLPDAELRRLARFIATELEALQGLQPTLLTAAEVANQYGVSRGWVYKHAHELGGQRLGTGPKARLRFLAPEVQRCLRDLQGSNGDTPRPSRVGRVPVELLPIGPRRTGPRRASRRPSSATKLGEAR
jgi:hypothetical protein